MLYTRVVIDIRSNRVLSRRSCAYVGPIAQCKGATSAQDELQTAQANFYGTLTSDYSTAFAGQQKILNSLMTVANPIFAAGPSQYGYSAAQTTGLDTQATQGTAQQYQAAEKAFNGQEAANSGGNSYIPSGATAQLNAGIASNAATQESNQLLGIQQAGYQQGYQNWLNAGNILGSAATQENPTGFAGQATGAGSAEGTTANQIEQANAAASPWGAIGGILGGAAGAFLGNPAAIGGMVGAGAPRLDPNS